MANLAIATLLVLLCFILNGRSVSPSSLPPRVFNVMAYGAVNDGTRDNRKAFVAAWRDACDYEGRGRVVIPRGVYALGSVIFEGYCRGSMSFIIYGVLRAPTDPRFFLTDTWIGFRYVDYLTVKGGGYLDGQGHVAWGYNNCKSNPNCNPLPATMRLDFVRNSWIHHLRSINSKNTHFSIFACQNLTLSNVRLDAPADSPNTDGIHIGSSANIRILNSAIRTGDDCISMVSGCRGVEVADVRCGPGHGISIGSLGRSHADEPVSGISVRNTTFVGTDNGVRIKTWAPSLATSASNITFQDIKMMSVANPILIDQDYCPMPPCLEGESAVQIQDVLFKNIWGTSNSKVAVKLQCSGARPCKNVRLVDIALPYSGRRGTTMALCVNVLGTSFGTQIPSGCL
ncbi:exopolygalacturonase-like [Salvia miltiorrhiza]|uniref:exopolygalacturonase-like n=1 Tax=Salvia miltiorrhiza TaxID=226208 RepID=UPI0025AD006C|nr:exopolygalacturonase-like [Salvia miltiorrhiza]